ncbi:hypothetical protein AAMO2058_000000600 [Amorphochlora amoebiformis]|mmetsp:Transcript_14999/g.23753  ORF Transcript_14999/g.23753 Transcript_14999/m.23753 type:complete len:136 (-) Transcript_14999:176-583(-)
MIRGVWQLQKLTISYCKTPASKGVYELLNSMEHKKNLIEFAKKNPQIQIKTQVNKSRQPHVIGEYVGTVKHTIGISNSAPSDILEVMQKLRDRSGRDTQTLTHWGKPISAHTSVQGKWIPSRAVTDTDVRVKRKA